MGSGLSMASVNKIKELAQLEQYEIAAPILDSQELEKSLNPQFLRICGEVYENVGRMKDARRLYIKAHSIAPESGRIILSIISYYYKRGFAVLAKQYTRLYEFFEGESPDGMSKLRFIQGQVEGKTPDELTDMLYPKFSEDLDDQWSFNLYIASRAAGKNDIYELLGDDYAATFKGAKKTQIISDISSGKDSAEKYLYIYPESENADDSEDEAEIRETEARQLAEVFGKIENRDAEEEPVFLSMTDVETDEDQDEEDEKESGGGLFGFFRRRRNAAKDSSAEDASDAADGEQSGANDESAENTETNTVNAPDPNLQDENIQVDAGSSVEAAASDENNADSDEVNGVNADALSEAEPAREENIAAQPEDIPEAAEDNIDDYHDDGITFELGDGFAPESDSIEGLKDIEGYETYSLDEEPEPIEDLETEYETEIDSYADAEPEEAETDTAADDSEVAEESEAVTEEVAAEEVEEVTEAVAAEEVEEVAEAVAEEVTESDIDTENTANEIEAEEEIVEAYTDEEVSETEAVVSETEAETAEVEAEAEAVEAEVDTEIVEAEVNAEEVDAPESEAEVAEVTVDAEVSETEAEVYTESEVTEVEEDTDSFETEVEAEEAAIESEVAEADAVDEFVQETIEEDNFPKFKNALFDNLDKDYSSVQNNFGNVAKEKQDRLDASLEEEERMQREAEDLIRSLGIDL